MICGEAILPFRRNAAGSCLVYKNSLMCSCIVILIGAKKSICGHPDCVLIFYFFLFCGQGMVLKPLLDARETPEG